MNQSSEERANLQRRAQRLADTAPAVAPGWLRDKVAWFLARTSVSYQDLSGWRRKPRVVRARALCAYLLRHWPGPGGVIPSYPEIALAMGKTNHSGPMTAIQRLNRTPPKNHWRNDLDDVKPDDLVREAIRSLPSPPSTGAEPQIGR